ncbi:MAG: tRNA pseudouridine(55) synthase TruB [Bacteroidetes bacterium]|nr:MAG: tRNA pseudouridine(55) synthase TruB [Bacteroidota bacterium]
MAGKVLSFDKPLNWTSFNLVNKVRVLLKVHLNIKKIKVGHAGTLDPLATGLLIICTGKATKKIQQFQDLKKEYIATIVLGKTTPSFDLETEVDKVFDLSGIVESQVKEALAQFVGDIQQVPPLFSAKNINGQRAYDLARRGVVKELAPNKVTIEEIELLEYNLPEIKIKVRCGKGTYIRSLARDIGDKLENGAYLSKLIRTKIGDYEVDNAWEIKKFEDSLKML